MRRHLRGAIVAGVVAAGVLVGSWELLTPFPAGRGVIVAAVLTGVAVAVLYLAAAGWVARWDEDEPAERDVPPLEQIMPQFRAVSDHERQVGAMRRRWPS